MASIKFVAVSRGLRGIVDYVSNKEKTTDALMSGVNCVMQTAVYEFESVKKQFHKTDGRAYYHIVQAFAPDDPVDFETVHKMGIELAEYFKGYQCIVATHTNTKHKHNHIIMNSVSFETGTKFHQTAKEMRQVKEFSNELCRKYGLSITEAKADPFRIPKWKKNLRKAIRGAMELCNTKEEFIGLMRDQGYEVKWEPEYKHITYTTPDNIRCRDNKLFDETLLRGNMELYFAMGGAAHFAEQQEHAYVYGEPAPTMDDVVLGTASVFAALLTGDEERFHFETIHYSEDELRRMKQLGKKVQQVVYTIKDDEEKQKPTGREIYYAMLLLENLAEQYMAQIYRSYDADNDYEDIEYDQYHGFDMTMGGM